MQFPFRGLSNLHVVGFRAGQIVIANMRQGSATSRIFSARPAQTGIKIITAIHEYRPRINSLTNTSRPARVAGPERRRETKVTVIHQGDCLIVGFNLHDPNNRAEVFATHQAHVVINPG